MKKILLTGLILLGLGVTGCADNSNSSKPAIINVNDEIANTKTASFENGVLKTDSLTIKIVGYEFVKKNEYSDYLRYAAENNTLIIKFDITNNISNTRINQAELFDNFFSVYQDSDPLPTKLNFNSVISSYVDDYPSSMSYEIKDDNADLTLIATKGVEVIGKQRIHNPNNN